MEIKNIKNVKTKEEAREIAIEWQGWQSDKSLSIEEMWEWQFYLSKLADKFGLQEEFIENGII